VKPRLPRTTARSSITRLRKNTGHNRGFTALIDVDLLRRARKYVFDYFYANTYAPVLEEVMREFHLDR